MNRGPRLGEFASLNRTRETRLYYCFDHFGRTRVRWRFRSARADNALIWGNKPRGAATAQILHVRIRSRPEGSRRDGERSLPNLFEDRTIDTNYGEALAAAEE